MKNGNPSEEPTNPPTPPSPVRTEPAQPMGTVVERFRRSMVMDYEKWHDGIGYDVDLLRKATDEELAEIEAILVNRSVGDWRDVEALAALNTPRARVGLREALSSPSQEIRVAVTRYAPDLVDEDEHAVALVNALEQAEFYRGLTQAMMQVAEFHPPAVIDALLRGTLARDGASAVHFAAMLLFIHGKADSPFDMEQRPFLLEFNTPDQIVRQAMFRELCERIGADAGPYLAQADRPGK